MSKEVQKIKGYEVLTEVPEGYEVIFFGKKLIAIKLDGIEKPIEFDFLNGIWREIELS